jgi:sn-glycerol 3-phosphate transport system permease protein
VTSLRSRRRRRDTGVAVAFLAPCFVVFAAFAYYPLYRLVYLSAHQPNRSAFIDRPDTFLGWGSIWRAISSEDFVSGLKVSATFMLMTVPLGLLLGVVLAVVADRRLRGIRIFQTIFSSTVASSVAVASVVFLTLLQPETGLWKDVEWLSLTRSASAIRAVALSSVWQNAGLTFVIILAALQAVPDEIREAATLDGYGTVRRFLQVTVPLISPALLFLAIVLVVHGLQVFAQFEILQPVRSAEPVLFKIADPSGVRTVSTRAAYSLGFFALTLFVSYAQFSLLEKRVHYGD